MINSQESYSDGDDVISQSLLQPRKFSDSECRQSPTLDDVILERRLRRQSLSLLERTDDKCNRDRTSSIVSFRKNVTFWRTEEKKCENVLKRVNQIEKVQLGKRKSECGNDEITHSKKADKKLSPKFKAGVSKNA